MSKVVLMIVNCLLAWDCGLCVTQSANSCLCAGELTLTVQPFMVTVSTFLKLLVEPVVRWRGIVVTELVA